MIILMEVIFSDCSDVLSEYSSTLSSGLAPPPDSTHKKGGTRSAVSSTNLLFQILEQFLQSDDSVTAVKALPIFLQAFLAENRSLMMVRPLF